MSAQYNSSVPSMMDVWVAAAAIGSAMLDAHIKNMADTVRAAQQLDALGYSVFAKTALAATGLDRRPEQ